MEPSVAVIGTTFVDCKGFAGQKYNPHGRNLGDIKFVHGGVGRNVAENLSFLRIPTIFVSTVDDSALGEEVLQRLYNAGVNLEYLARAKEKGMGIWLAILDQNGDLAGSISRMPDLELLQKLVNERGPQLIESVSHVALEIDLNEQISRTVIEIAYKTGKSVYCIPGNLEVVLKHRDLLRYTDCFICNDIEAGQLLDRDLAGMQINELQETVANLASTLELPMMVVTLGERGSVFYEAETGEKGYQPAFPTRVQDSSGAGDAFFSGTVTGLVRQRPLREAVMYGTMVAAWTLQKEENTCPELPEKIKEEELFKNII